MNGGRLCSPNYQSVNVSQYHKTTTIVVRVLEIKKYIQTLVKWTEETEGLAYQSCPFRGRIHCFNIV